MKTISRLAYLFCLTVLIILGGCGGGGGSPATQTPNGGDSTAAPASSNGSGGSPAAPAPSGDSGSSAAPAPSGGSGSSAAPAPGGGSGGGSPAAAAPNKATVKLSTQGTLPTGSQLAGIAVSIELPSGVTVGTDASGAVLSGVVDVTGVAAASGITAVGPVIYTPASATAAGTLQFTMAASNFGTGEFATVNFNLAPGSTPPTADLVTIAPADQALRPVTTLTVVLAVQLS